MREVFYQSAVVLPNAGGPEGEICRGCIQRVDREDRDVELNKVAVEYRWASYYTDRDGFPIIRSRSTCSWRRCLVCALRLWREDSGSDDVRAFVPSTHMVEETARRLPPPFSYELLHEIEEWQGDCPGFAELTGERAKKLDEIAQRVQAAVNTFGLLRLKEAKVYTDGPLRWRRVDIRESHRQSR